MANIFNEFRTQVYFHKMGTVHEMVTPVFKSRTYLCNTPCT